MMVIGLWMSMSLLDYVDYPFYLLGMRGGVRKLYEQRIVEVLKEIKEFDVPLKDELVNGGINLCGFE